MKRQHLARAALLPLLASLLLPGCGSGGGGPAPEYTVTATAGPGGNIAPASATVAHGATASFTVTPDAGYRIDAVSGCGGALSGDTFTTGPVTADCAVSASFAAIEYTVTASAGLGGAITPASATVAHGATASFTVTPDAGYRIDAVAGCGGALSGDTFTTGPVTADCAVSASFAAIEHTVTATAGLGGSIAPASATVAHGATASFTLTPDAGFVIDTVSGCGGTLNGDTFTTGPVTADCAVSASFAVGLVTVSAAASAAPGTAAPVTGGTVTGAGSFNAGDLVTLAARPAPGFAFVDWRENGATVSTRAAYAFTAAADRSLTARFRLARPLRGDMPASATTALALGDLDGDGHLDMVAVNDDLDPNYGGTAAYYTSTRVWLGNGHGAFTDSGQALTGSFTHVTSAALGDLDGDGDLDLVLGLFNTTIIIFRNDGRGVFALFQSYTDFNVTGTHALALADLDGDGDLDLVEGNIGANRVWLNDGSGAFTDSGQALGAADTVGLALADLDGDGDLDLVAGNRRTGDTSAVWLNDGSGVFTDSGQALAGAGSAALGGALALGDLDGDGDPDLVIRYACASISGTCNDATILYRNDGSGVFTSVRTFSGFTNAVALGDLNGDGHLDLVEGRANGNPANSSGAYDGLPNRVWLGDGQGGFAPAVPVLDNIPVARAVAAAQLDAAPGPELVVCSNTACDIWAGDAGGNYAGAPLQTLTVSGANSTFMEVITGDLNGDGAADIVVTGNGTHLFISDGAASGPAFTAAGVLGGGSLSAALGDLDGDGDLDLVTGGVDGTNVTIWKNDGSAGFTGTALTGTSQNDKVVRLGDLDGDGDLDLAVVRRYSYTVVIYRNDGSGGFTGPVQQLLTSSHYGTSNAVLADFDGDGRLDLAVADSFVGLHLWRGNGDATFTDTGRTLATAATAQTNALAAVDIDGDGDPDLVAGHDDVGYGDPVPDTVWINDGAGAFTPAAPLRAAGMNRTTGLAMADIDGDGDPDLIAAHRDGGLSIHRNAAVP